jgi:hypothetical protein
LFCVIIYIEMFALILVCIVIIVKLLYPLLSILFVLIYCEELGKFYVRLFLQKHLFL